MLSVILAALFFGGIHLGVAGTRLRDASIGAIGPAYRALFSLASAAGPVSIDAKRRRNLGDQRWQAFADRTSLLPFGAIMQGRNRFSAAEIGVWRPLAGVVAYALMLGGHAPIIGVSPFP